MLSISKGNTKIGKIHNISLTPIATCPKAATCKKDCYAMKSYKQYPNVRNAWNKNTDIATNDPDVFWAELDDHITKHKPEYFRFHVAGDCPDRFYMIMAIRLAKVHPGTQFLMFTKRYDWAHSCADTIPENMSLVLSAWPGMDIKVLKAKVNKFRVAWLSDDDRCPSKVHSCPGSCKDCKECWQKDGQDICFEKH